MSSNNPASDAKSEHHRSTHPSPFGKESSLKPVIVPSERRAPSSSSNRGHRHGSRDETHRKDASRSGHPHIKLSKQELEELNNKMKEQEYLVEIIKECATIASELHWESLENWKKLVKDVKAIEHYSLEDDEVTRKKKYFLASYMQEIAEPYKRIDAHVNHPQFYDFFRKLNVSKVDLSASELKAFRDALVASRPEKQK